MSKSQSQGWSSGRELFCGLAGIRLIRGKHRESWNHHLSVLFTTIIHKRQVLLSGLILDVVLEFAWAKK